VTLFNYIKCTLMLTLRNVLQVPLSVFTEILKGDLSKRTNHYTEKTPSTSFTSPMETTVPKQ